MHKCHVHASMQRFVLGDNSIPRYVSVKDCRVGSRICTSPHLIHKLGQGCPDQKLNNLHSDPILVHDFLTKHKLGQGCPDQHLDNLHCDAILGQDFLTKYLMILCMFALSQSGTVTFCTSLHGAAPSLARAVAASR